MAPTVSFCVDAGRDPWSENASLPNMSLGIPSLRPEEVKITIETEALAKRLVIAGFPPTLCSVDLTVGLGIMYG